MGLLESHLHAVECEMGIVVAEKKNLKRRVAALDVENVVAREELEKVRR